MAGLSQALPVPLVGVLHPSASAGQRAQALAVIDRVLLNLLVPLETVVSRGTRAVTVSEVLDAVQREKTARVRIDSQTWQHSVLPAVLALRLYDWLQDRAGFVEQQVAPAGSSAPTVAPGPTTVSWQPFASQYLVWQPLVARQRAEGAARQPGASLSAASPSIWCGDAALTSHGMLQAMRAAHAEVTAVRAAHGTTPRTASPSLGLPALLRGCMNDLCARHLLRPNAALEQQQQVIAVVRTEWAALQDCLKRLLVLHYFHMAPPAKEPMQQQRQRLVGAAGTSGGACGVTDLHAMAAAMEEVSCGACMGLTASSPLSSPPTSSTPFWVAVLERMDVGFAALPVRVTLTQLEEEARVLEAEVAEHVRQALRSPCDEVPRDSVVVASGGVEGSTARRRVAERMRREAVRDHRATMLEERSDAPLNTAGTQERLLVATRLINDIAGVMEQVDVLEERPGFSRADRIEAKRLHAKFRGDGDIGYLHDLLDEWHTNLQQAKEAAGKATVYL